MFLSFFLWNDKLLTGKGSIKKSKETIFSENGFLTFFDKSALVSRTLVGLIDLDGIVRISNYEEFEIPSSFHSVDVFLTEALKYPDVPIIIFDQNKQETTIIRDIFGTVPVFYIHIPGKLYAYSSSLSSLLNIKELETFLELDSTKIREYLTWLKDGEPFSSRSFFKNIKRLLPGQRIALDFSRVLLGPFHQFDLSGSIDLTAPKDYSSAFRKLFSESVKKGIPAADKKQKIISHLSGGLDSSSVCGMIRNVQNDLLFDTIYINTKTDLTSESSYAQDTASYIKSNHHTIDLDDNHLQAAELHISFFGQPEYLQNSSIIFNDVIKTAKELGCTVIFDGHQGDGIVGYGVDYLRSLFTGGNWAELKRLLQGDHLLDQSYKNYSIENPVHKTIYALLSQEKQKLKKLELARLVIKASRYFDIPLVFFLNKGIRKLRDKLFLPSSIARIEKVPELMTIPETYCNANQYVGSKHLMADTGHFEASFSEQIININEEFFILDLYHGIQHRFPFLDKALFELCMVTPSEIKYGGGSRRNHMREAMKGLIPKNVRTRRSKANFGLYGRQAVVKLLNQSEHLLAADSEVWKYVNMKEFNRAKRLLSDDSKPLYIYNKMQFFVSRTIYLSIWLNMLKNKSFVSFIDNEA
jgi:asparagine synthase (glutamine-hydrolysing)